ncbi:MAG: site-specific integrase [Desulfosarcina sp.]|nr:site-specific integrase [Desulfosarcina sp.]
MFIDKLGYRKNKTIGSGRESLAKAIKAGERIARQAVNCGQARKKLDSVSGTPVFADYSKKWLEENASRWEEGTYDRYDSILKLHVWPHACYRKQIGAITRTDIKQHLRRVKRSPKTVELIHTVISGIFNEAVDDGIVNANPSAGLLKKILPPKKKRYLRPSDPFNRQDRDLFLSCAKLFCPWDQQLILKVMAYAGLRLGEVLAMRFEHLDFAKMTYFVSQGYKLKSFKTPKSGNNRLVDLPAFLAEELQKYVVHLRKKLLKAGRGGGRVDLLFIDPDENGPWPYSQRKIQMLLKRVCKKAGLRIRNPHDLRHTYATVLLMAHQSPGYVQRQLGHSSISITMDIYCHWTPGEGRRDLEAALLGVEKGLDAGPNPVRKTHIFAYK